MNNLVLLSLVYFVKGFNNRDVIENFAEDAQCSGTIFVILKQEGCALEIKVATDQENIFHFELRANKV